METEPTCLVCHRDGVAIYAKGLCRTHYLKDLRMRKDGTTDEERSMEAAGESSDLLSEADPVVPVLGNQQGAGSSVNDSPYMVSGEQRPGAGVGTPSSPAQGAAGQETAPKAPEGRLRKLFLKKDKPKVSVPGASPSSTKERRPSSGGRQRRESAAETISDGWAALGGVAIRTGTHAPLGRCMQWQAPVAGEMLDDALKGSIVDKMALQRVVKGRQRFDLLGAVLGPPLLVLAIERNPDAAKSLMPMLASSIRHSLPLMVPAIKKAKERERKVAEATALLFEDDPDFPAGEDPVAYILSMMFEGWVPPQPQAEPVPVPDAYQDQPVP